MPAFLVSNKYGTGGVRVPFFFPSAVCNRVTDITEELLRGLGAEALLLDVDNTLAPDGSQEPFPGTVEWTYQIRRAGFKILILSNNFKDRVEPFARQYGLPYLSVAMKPLPAGYLLAAGRLKTERKKTVVVGDQIFTDIIGANLAGMKSILLTPAQEESSVSFKIRRALERPVRRRLGLRSGRENQSGGG